MDYHKVYKQIMERAKNRVFSDEEYYEKHHVKPRCLGGSDDEYNIVGLTPREHYVAHQLLCQMYPTNNKILLGALMMCVDNEYRGTRSQNRLYEWMRKKFSDNHPSKTERGKEKIRNGLKKYFDSDEWKIKRKHKHENARETRYCACGCGESFVTFRKSSKVYMFGHANKNKKLLEETKLKQSESLKKTLSLLSENEMKERMKNSLGSTDHVKRGASISSSKKGKKTNQQEIMGKRYANMSDSEFESFLDTKSTKMRKRFINLRNKWKQ